MGTDINEYLMDISLETSLDLRCDGLWRAYFSAVAMSELAVVASHLSAARFYAMLKADPQVEEKEVRQHDEATI